jgi:hypothetical protein
MSTGNGSAAVIWVVPQPAKDAAGTVVQIWMLSQLQEDGNAIGYLVPAPSTRMVSIGSKSQTVQKP